MDKRVLVVAAHPDDELLGCAGTVAKLVKAGARARCIILGEGQASRFDSEAVADRDLIVELHRNTLKAAEVVGFEDVLFSGFPDNRLDAVDLLDIVKAVEAVIRDFGPNVIMTHYAMDTNIDHRRAFDAVLAASRPLPGSSIESVYAFETLSATEWNFGPVPAFKPNVFVDIAEELEVKVEAMECYESELCAPPHPRSVDGIRSLARFRGLSAGLEYAEAFMLARAIAR